MTKNTLLLSAAAMAILSSGTAAVAGQITGTGTFTGVNNTTGSTAYTLASELRFSASATTSAAFSATQGNLTYTFLPTSTGGFPNGESLLLTVDVGGAVFSSTSAVISATGAGCTASVSAATPVAVGSASATYFVNFSSCTTSSSGLSISLPVQVTGANAVTSGAGLQSSFGGQLFAVDGGRVQATFVSSTAAFSATIVTGTATNVADVQQQYTAFTSATTASSSATVTVAVNNTVRTDLAGTTASASDIAGVTITGTIVTGSFTGFNLAATGATTTAGAGTSATISTVRTISIPSATVGTTTITIADNTGTSTASPTTLNAPIPAASITLSAAVDLLTGAANTGKFVDFSRTSAAYAVTSRNGASFVAPWVALGSTVSTSSIRLGNNGATPTGPISVVLLSDNGTNTPTATTVVVNQALLQAGTLNAQGGIDAGDVVTIASNRLASLFGTNAANGDIQVSIESVGNVISAKVRATQSSGQVFETSLGNLNAN